MKSLLQEVKLLFLNFIKTTFYSSRRAQGENDKLYEEIRSQRIHDNLVRIFPSALLLIVIELGGRVTNLIFDINVQGWVSNLYTITLVAFIVVSVVFFFIINKQIQDSLISDKVKLITIAAFWFCYFANALIFSCLEMYDQGTINNYMVFIAVFTFIPTLGPFISSAFYLLSFLIETYAIYSFKTAADPQERMIICLSLTFLGLAVSTLLYSSSISDNISKKKFEHLSETDPMTLMLNRRGMKRQTDILWANCKRHNIEICAIMVDIDFFKGYNDTFGHAMGDECIKAVADCIKDSFKRKSDATARYGGEEFLIITSGASAEDMFEHVLNMQDKVRNLKMEAGNKTVSDVVTISAGMFAGYPKYFDNIEQFIENADAQLYNVKEHGRNGLSYKDEVYRTKAAVGKTTLNKE